MPSHVCPLKESRIKPIKAAEFCRTEWRNAYSARRARGDDPGKARRMSLNSPTEIAVFAICAILAITFHEAAHGFVALHFGDSTAKDAGRVTLNPIKHIDPFGTI